MPGGGRTIGKLPKCPSVGLGGDLFKLHAGQYLLRYAANHAVGRVVYLIADPLNKGAKAGWWSTTEKILRDHSGQPGASCRACSTLWPCGFHERFCLTLGKLVGEECVPGLVREMVQ
ncbi:hypothetical protein GCM10023318_31110 [Nocardia callitridis]|uniref:Uncharacterized protein n=1 Tax=Nocardia callitridis TaxID=648753 RepID=A0ABP9KBB3_9NOCA